MAKEQIKDLLAQSTVDLDNKYLTVSTISDGFTGTLDGRHLYHVEKKGQELAVYPVLWSIKEGKLVHSDDPIIYTEDTAVFFVVRTTVDPYNFPAIQKEVIKATQDKGKQVLQAFLAFADDKFSFGNYNLFIDSEPFVDDGKVLVPTTGITVSKQTLAPKVGATDELTVTLVPAESTDEFTFTVANTATATVVKTGKKLVATGVLEGTTKVTIKAGTIEKEVTINVTTA